MIVNKANPLYRRELKKAPARPLGDRILVRQMPISETTETGLFKPEVAQERQFAGTLLAAGDDAADKLYDYGVEIGDEIWFAKYAGLLEEWQHIVHETDTSCPHETWDFVPKNDDAMKHVPKQGMINEVRSCRACGTVRVSEKIIVLRAEDIVMDTDLQVRIERGEMKRVLGVTDTGRTRFVMRRSDALTTFEDK